MDLDLVAEHMSRGYCAKCTWPASFFVSLRWEVHSPILDGHKTRWFDHWSGQLCSWCVGGYVAREDR